MYELYPYPLEVYWMCENEIPTSRLPKVIVLQTYTHHRNLYTTPLRDGQKMISRKLRKTVIDSVKPATQL